MTEPTELDDSLLLVALIEWRLRSIEHPEIDNVDPCSVPSQVYIFFLKLTPEDRRALLSDPGPVRDIAERIRPRSRKAADLLSKLEETPK